MTSATGSFTQIGNASEPDSLVTRRSTIRRGTLFTFTISPINGAPGLGGSDEINAATGAITQVVLPLLGPEEPQFVAGLGVDTNNGQLYGLVSEAGSSPVFGSIDPATGSFTQIGNASEPIGYYAPIYDPARNVFYVTISPINGTGLLGGFDEINAATGAITQVVLPLLGPEEPHFVAGLGVDTNNGQLYDLVSEAGGSPVFGSIGPATGSFTQIGNASEPIGYYAPVYDPARNVFYVTISPINGTGLLGGSGWRSTPPPERARRLCCPPRSRGTAIRRGPRGRSGKLSDNRARADVDRATSHVYFRNWRCLAQSPRENLTRDTFSALFQGHSQ